MGLLDYTKRPRVVVVGLDEPAAQARVTRRPGHLFPPSLVAKQFQALQAPVDAPGAMRLDAAQPPAALAEAMWRATC